MVYKKADGDSDDDRTIRGFKYVPVFDISQTDGEKVPSICHRISGDDPLGLFAQLESVAHSIGFTVENVELPGGTNGDCTHALHRIRIEITNSPRSVSRRSPTNWHMQFCTIRSRIAVLPSSRPNRRRT